MLNRYEKGAARCMRAAEQVDDAVLSLGLRNMAQAWLELGKKMPRLVESSSSRRREAHCDTKSGRVTARSRGTSPTKRHGKNPSKIAAKHGIRSH